MYARKNWNKPQHGVIVKIKNAIEKLLHAVC